MQTPFRDSLETVTLFSRERRRKRMLQFLEAFERRSWLCEPEMPFLVPVSREDVRNVRSSAADFQR